jgi:sigma-B regulation protein RsbU (phosphoserine phosphatase)
MTELAERLETSLSDGLEVVYGQSGPTSELEELTSALQQLLLPPRVPEIEGLSVAWAYRPASALQVGGDFLDLFPLGDGAWGLGIGDVCGKGPKAATIAAAARHALRAAAVHRRQPSEVLGVLNETLLMDAEEDAIRFCTVAYGRIRPYRDGFRITIACAGHPPPMVVDVNGRVSDLGVSGTVVGVVEDVEFNDYRVFLRPGDTAVFFTDGLTETRSSEGDLLERSGVRRALGACASSDPQALVGHLMRAAERHGFVRDDMALVAVQVDRGR